MRFFVGMFSHETNTFSTIPSDRRQFEARDLRCGGEILEAYRGTGTCLSGLVEPGPLPLQARAPSHLPAGRSVRARLAATLAIFTAGVLAGVLAAHPAAPRMSAHTVLDVVSDELRWKQTRVRVNLDTWEAGAETGRHQHPGPALLYVLEGELEEVGADALRTLRAGEAVWNRARTSHNVRNRGDRVARVLAVHLEPGR